MPPVKSLPSSTVLEWHDRTSILGGTRHVTPACAKPLAGALGAETAPQGVLRSLGSKLGVGPKSVPPRRPLDATFFDALKRLDGYQRDVSEIVPFAPNNVPSIVGSLGESVARYEMAGGNFDEDGQYTKQTSRNVAVSGSGVCTHANTLLYDVVVGAEQRLAEQAQQARRRGDSTAPPFRPLPVTLIVNTLPQVLMLVGDPRESDKLLAGDSWAALVLAKDFRNATYASLPYSVRSQSVAGASSGGRGISAEELAELSAQRPARATVDDYLAAHHRPIIGDALLRDIARSYEADRAQLCHLVLTASDPALVYENPEGEVFQPGIDSAAYQRHRHALQHPAYGEFLDLRERLGHGDATT
jgi:hypothetical protein